MGLKQKVERLRRRIPHAREKISLSWVAPDTGEVSWSVTLTPCPGGRGYSVVEQTYGEGVSSPQGRESAKTRRKE